MYGIYSSFKTVPIGFTNSATTNISHPLSNRIVKVSSSSTKVGLTG